ncbi:uncharacterized protein VTP21DRAFT_10338 [Calcarisporiella thermophila]|uniref:uncharacterized protein n=1 Tax=Calcarisporiella thermophila TaxID=911321 RepID=UPI00374201B0
MTSKSKKAASTPQDEKHQDPPKTDKDTKTTPDADDENEENQEEQKGEKAKANKDMRHMTAHVQEERDMVDEIKLGEAVRMLGEARDKQKTGAAPAKDAEKVALSKEDVALIMEEMQVTRQQAERQLRESNGDLVAALQNLVSC